MASDVLIWWNSDDNRRYQGNRTRSMLDWSKAQQNTVLAKLCGWSNDKTWCSRMDWGKNQYPLDTANSMKNEKWVEWDRASCLLIGYLKRSSWCWIHNISNIFGVHWRTHCLRNKDGFRFWRSNGELLIVFTLEN